MPYSIHPAAQSNRTHQTVNSDTDTKIVARLDAWAARGAPGEQRDVAVFRIRLCVERGETSLDLRGLGLRKAPGFLPPALESFDISGNRLKEFSTKLPAGLKTLNVSDNVLSEFSAKLPDGLKSLDLGNNRLIGLPELPSFLEQLAAGGNCLVDLPSDLPINLSADFSGNRDGYSPLIKESIVKKMSTASVDVSVVAVPQVFPEKTTSQPSVLQAPLQEIPEAAEQPIGALPFRMDPRFGEGGYSIERPLPAERYQTRLTDDGAKGSGLDSPFVILDLDDLGYATQVEYADGRHKTIVPGSEPNIVHSADAVHGHGLTIPLPDVINATLVHLPQATGGVDYVAFTLNGFNSDAGIATRNAYYAPFCTYRQVDGTIVGIAWYGEASPMPYRFSVDARSLPMAALDRNVTLTRATPQDLQCMSGFQDTLFADRSVDPIIKEAVKLKDETSDVKAKFDAVFARSVEMLDNAIYAKRRFPLLVKAILAKLVGVRMSDAKVAPMLEALSANWQTMRDSMPHLESQSADAVGFFDGAHNDLAGLTLGGTMIAPYSLAHVAYPVMTFSESIFKDASIPLDMLAATLIHEYSHALLKTDDTMDSAQTVDIYYREKDNGRKISLAPLERAAALKGSQPENHASTFEAFTEMCSYLADEKTYDLVMRYLESPASHGYRRAEDDLRSGNRFTAREKASSDLPTRVIDAPPNRSRREYAADRQSPAARRPAQSSARIASVRLRS
jgi:hypothetical protein